MSKNYGKVVDITPTGSTQYSTSYTPAMAVDGSTGTYWRPTNADTVRSLTFALGTSRIVDKLRLYLSSSYAPSACVVSGSNDGTTFSDIATLNPSQTSGWVELTFSNTTGYTYYKVTFTTLYSSYLYLYEIELWYVLSWVKADGHNVVVKFTEDLTTNPSATLGYAYRQLTNAIVTTLNAYSTSYPATALIDGVANTSAYWYGTTAINWIKLELTRARAIQGFRWYIASASYYPLTFTISGSNDGSTWTQLGDTFTGTSTTGWQAFTFTNTTEYKYYRIDTLTASSSRMYISEVQLLIGYGNEAAFTVTGSEYDFLPDGTLQTITYDIESVYAHTTEENAIVLETRANDRFCSVVGNLTVAYNADVGNIAGLGGKAESFSTSFAPTDLVAKPHQRNAQHVEISGIAVTAVYTHVYYTNAKEEERVEISNITATGVRTNINDL